MTTASMNQPGVRERHLLRRRDNPLFDDVRRQVSNEDLALARLEDGLERDRFMEDFQALVRKAAALEPNTPSDTVLEIKEALDQSYQQACALPGDQEHIKEAIRNLIAAIMRAVRSAAGEDSFAQQQLQEEDVARQAHFELQGLPLISALTHPRSPVGEDELVPTLLSEPDEDLLATLVIFDPAQVATICSDASDLLQSKDPGRTLTDAWRRLGIIENYYRSLKPASPAN